MPKNIGHVESDSQFVVKEYFSSDEMQATWREDGSLYIEIDSPWQGDTQTGFGANCSIEIEPVTAQALAKWFARTGERDV